MHSGRCSCSRIRSPRPSGTSAWSSSPILSGGRMLMPAAANGNAKQEVAVLAHDINQNPGHRGHSFITVLGEKAAVVMPVANAGVRLPRRRLNDVARAALVIFHNAGPPREIDAFDIDDRLIVAVPTSARVVEMRNDVQIGRAEGQFSDVVKVEKVRLVLIQ